MQYEYMTFIKFSASRKMTEEEIDALQRDVAAQVEEPQGNVVTSNVVVTITSDPAPYVGQN
jgi:hypothetical protein